MRKIPGSNRSNVHRSQSITGMAFSSQLAIGDITERENVDELCGSAVVRHY